jgi:hypothetical protein
MHLLYLDLLVSRRYLCMRCLVAPADLLSVLGMHACVCAGKCLPALPVHAMGPMAWAKPNCLRVCIVWNWHTKSVCVAPCCSAEDTLKLDFTTDSLDQPDPFGHKAVVPADVVDAIRRVGVPRSLVVLLAVSCWQVVCCPQRQGCHLRTRSLHSCDREKGLQVLVGARASMVAQVTSTLVAGAAELAGFGSGTRAVRPSG